MGKSVYKKQQAMLEKMARRSGVDPKLNPITAGWMFNKWYEKLIMIGLMILGVWKLFELVFM